MTEDEPIAWLYGLQSLGVKLGLDGMRGLLDLLDHPERSYPAALIGGTNGKGSVSAMLDAMLSAAGYEAGLYTSPHLVRPNERIRVGGADIDTPGLHRALQTVRRACERGLSHGSLSVHPSFFEVMTAAALWTFRERRIDVAVLEVGLGGRLDATNVTEPLVSAIVTVGVDHVGTLGETLATIAGEKAGIIRSGRALISGVEAPEALAVLRDRCRSIGATLIDARGTDLPAGVRLSLDGAHQTANARVAVTTFRELASAAGLSFGPGTIREGLESTRWPGRLQLVPGPPAILLDGAHNEAGALALAAHLAVRGGPKPVLLFATMADKDVRAILRPLAPCIERAVLTRPDVLRAADPRHLTAAAAALGISADAEPVPARALEKARALAGPGGLVLVAGSLYLVGSVLGLLEGAPSPGPVSM